MIFVDFRLTKNIFFNKTDRFLGRTTSNYACQIFCAIRNCAKRIIIKLPKKGDLSDCNNWRGVTLLSVPSKIFLRVLLNRIDKSIDAKLREEQAGFRPNRGCIDHIFTIRNILEQCIEWNSKLILNFVDFQKAFDSVNRESIWQILAAYGIPAKIITLIKAFYNNYECCVLNNGQQSEWFKVNTGSGKDV